MTGIALLGAGRMGRVHAHSIATSSAELVVVFDVAPAAADALAAEHGAKTAASAEMAMDDSAVDAIVIATPSDTHADLLIVAVKTGKPVLIEKPVAASYAEAKRVIQAIGNEAARRVFVGFNRRFDRGHASVREAVHAGEIGRLEQLSITSRDPFPPPLAYMSRSGGLFRDMMIHDFDMAHSIAQQEFVSVTAHGSSVIDPEIGKLGDIDTASVTLLAADGTIVTIQNSRRCVFGFDQRVEAFGSKGMVISDNPRQSGFTRYTADSPGIAAPLHEFFKERYGPTYSAEIALFLKHAQAGTDMPVNALDGLYAAYLAEAAAASLKRGSTIHLTGSTQEFSYV